MQLSCETGAFVQDFMLNISGQKLHVTKKEGHLRPSLKDYTCNFYVNLQEAHSPFFIKIEPFNAIDSHAGILLNFR